MDYKELALEFIEKMHLMNKARPQRKINESMQGEHFILQFLDLHNGSALPSEISSTMGISSARIAAALNSLERKGLVTRQIDKSDRRRIIVDLTPEGRAFSETHHQKMLEDFTKLFSQMGEQDACEYVRLTGKLVEIVIKNKDKL